MGISSRISTFSIILVAVFLIGAFLFRSHTIQNDSVQHTTVRWLLSHQPTSVFARSTAVFADELSKRTNGRLKLEIVTPEELGYPSTGDIPNADVLKYLHDGRVQLATTYSVPLGKADSALWAVNLPFLFADYASAGSVLDGAGAMSILDTVAEKTDTHALAFTMSGGFRIFASRVSLAAPADFRGKKIATSGGPIAEETIAALGATPVPMDLENYNHGADLGSVDAVETTYSRLSEVLTPNSSYTKHIAETNHSMFLTVILAGDSFYQTLSSVDQSALRDAALAAAKVERQDSIALGDKTKAALAAGGSKVVVFTDAQRKAMKDSTKSVYARFTTDYGTSSVQAIEQ